MITRHKIIYNNSNNLTEVDDRSIQLVVTSPPYPMIEMWDEVFGLQNPHIIRALNEENGRLAFELMNKELDRVWDEVDRVLINGGIVCINIGDATRKIGQDFQLYSNHSRILQYFISKGYQVLPGIIWRKPTNAPNKFMGSGMLPPGAYVTLEHEYILVLRKGGIRNFRTAAEKNIRRKSAFFWEERNLWFSDVWSDLRGINQKIKNNGKQVRTRSAAYPFDLVYRLINMFSVQEDNVLDPFLGTGTTTLASMVSGRNSFGVEIDKNFKEIIAMKIKEAPAISRSVLARRLMKHKEFVYQRSKEKKPVKYINHFYQLPVITKQEVDLVFPVIKSVTNISTNTYEVYYMEENIIDKDLIPKINRSKKITNYLK